MSISVQTNVGALNALENLRTNTNFQSQTINRLTSGFRINSSGDDAAGLSVANGYRSQVAELNQGVRNANDGLSTLQIIDGGLNNITKIVDRLKTLATQSASDTFTGDRATLDTEFKALLTEIDRQAANVGLNASGTNLKDIAVYIGGGGATQANSQVTVKLSGATNQVDATGLKINSETVDTGAHALAAITKLDDATKALGIVQANVGTGQNSLQYAINLAQSQSVNFSAAESRIRDADIASEASNLTKAQVLQQSSMAALAQANSAPQAVLSLLR